MENSEVVDIAPAAPATNHIELNAIHADCLRAYNNSYTAARRTKEKAAAEYDAAVLDVAQAAAALETVAQRVVTASGIDIKNVASLDIPNGVVVLKQ